MKIINKTKGPIYFSTNFPPSQTYPSGAADCGRIELDGHEYLGYQDVPGSLAITLLSDDNSHQGSYQNFPIQGSSDITVSITVD